MNRRNIWKQLMSPLMKDYFLMMLLVFVVALFIRVMLGIFIKFKLPFLPGYDHSMIAIVVLLPIVLGFVTFKSVDKKFNWGKWIYKRVDQDPDKLF